MKRINIYTCMSLLLLMITTVYGQSNAEGARLSPDEQAAFEKSVPLNPAKANPMADLKSETTGMSQPGTARWKSEGIADEDRWINEANKYDDIVVGCQAKPLLERTQPEPQSPVGKTLNRRDIQGSRQQPEAPKPVNVTDKRTIIGSRTQPAGEKPKR